VVHVDFNLLIALDALLEENSVAAAADRLNLSPPAMSRTLARIRRATGDDILVRTGRTMTPTPRALELREETRELVRRGTAVLTPPRTLDLDILDRAFTIRSHDALASALALPLTAAIAQAAPHVKLRFLAEPAADVSDLARGRTDLEVGATEPSRPEIAADTIGTDQMVAVFRNGHPLSDGELTPERFAAACHVSVSRRGRLRGAIDDALAERGLRRPVIAALPTAAAALDLAARSDLVTAVTERVCRPAWTRLGLRTSPLPFYVPPVPVILSWHHRNDSDPAHAWLRDQIRTALLAILEVLSTDTKGPRQRGRGRKAAVPILGDSLPGDLGPRDRRHAFRCTGLGASRPHGGLQGCSGNSSVK
jgi:DNA-binding transcriptional LysR family regulator